MTLDEAWKRFKDLEEEVQKSILLNMINQHDEIIHVLLERTRLIVEQIKKLNQDTDEHNPSSINQLLGMCTLITAMMKDLESRAYILKSVYKDLKMDDLSENLASVQKHAENIMNKMNEIFMATVEKTGMDTSEFYGEG